MSFLPDYFLVQLMYAPLPAQLVTALRQIEVECALNRAASFRLSFALSRTEWGDLDVLALPILRPLVPVTIRVAFGLGVPQALINGFIQHASLKMGDAPGTATLEVVGSDMLGTAMPLIQQPMPWPAMPDSEIVRALFAKYALAPLVDPLPPTRTAVDTITTQLPTDAQYVIELADTYGFDLFIAPEPVSGNDFAHFHLPIPPPATQGTLSIDFGMETNLEQFDVNYDMLAPTGVVGFASDPFTRVPTPIVAPLSADLPRGMEPALNRIMPPPIERARGGLGGANPAEAMLRATARATRTSRAINASGEVNSLKFGRILHLGLPVAIRGAGREHSGYYDLATITHLITRDGYTQYFTARRNAVGLTGAEIFVDPLAAAA